MPSAERIASLNDAVFASWASWVMSGGGVSSVTRAVAWLGAFDAR